MAPYELTVLLATAASLGLIHTILGPDHYIPFIMMGKAGNWSLKKTCLVTALCGIGHVLGSLLLGVIGIGIGIGLHSIDLIDTVRGTIAAWLFIAFGLTYFVWGLKNAIRNKPHTHIHEHPEGLTHKHLHVHSGSHMHVHESEHVGSVEESTKPNANNQKRKIGIWALFVIFIFGPCEPLIPLLMYPAAKLSTGGVIAVSATFMVFTVSTMVAMVSLGYTGVKSVRIKFTERFMHAIAGFAILLCGIGIAFLGL
ncbi:MAG: hypothetical protein RG741_08810 [Bacteroidales bacterium]|nr:hypothetical protein [Bacteroidales bacterium]